MIFSWSIHFMLFAIVLAIADASDVRLAPAAIVMATIALSVRFFER